MLSKSFKDSTSSRGFTCPLAITPIPAQWVLAVARDHRAECGAAAGCAAALRKPPFASELRPASPPLPLLARCDALIWCTMYGDTTIFLADHHCAALQQPQRVSTVRFRIAASRAKTHAAHRRSVVARVVRAEYGSAVIHRYWPHRNVFHSSVAAANLGGHLRCSSRSAPSAARRTAADVLTAARRGG